MFAKLYELIFTNWKTTASGLASILIWILDEVLKLGLDAEQKTFITTTILGIGLFLSKDGNVSGDGK